MEPEPEIGARVQPDADSAEAVFLAGAEMADPGILGVLTSVPRLRLELIQC